MTMMSRHFRQMHVLGIALFGAALFAGCDAAGRDGPTQAPVAVAPPAPRQAQYAGGGRDVLLQGFHWNSHRWGWWNIVAAKAPDIQAAGFTMVWLPPASRAADSAGYLPSEWRNLDASRYGTGAQLRSAVSALKTRGVRVIADVVVNHRVGTANWADFSSPAFTSNAQAVVRNDEWGLGTGNNDTGDGYHAARDLDHTYSSVQTEITGWLGWMKQPANAGFDGWRYDYVRGFSGSYVGAYNTATAPYFSVGELWPDIAGDYYASCSGANYHRQKLMDWIDATGARSAAFDFTTKWQLQLAVERTEYWRMGCIPGAIGWWPEMSVTFIDNHDTGPSPDGGQNHWPFPGARVEQGYAYILTHPGTPTVYWPHYFDWGADLQNKIRTLVQIRKQQGVTSTSTISVQAADATRYAAIVNANLAMKIGPGSWSPGAGWALAASGNDWAVWTK
jgi:alpha-amylase